MRSRGYTGKQVLSLEATSHTNCTFNTTARRRGMLISEVNPKRTWHNSATDKMWSCELQIQSSSSTKLRPTALFSNMLAIVRFYFTSRNRTLKQLNAPVVNILNNTRLIWTKPVQHAAADTKKTTTQRYRRLIVVIQCQKRKEINSCTWHWLMIKGQCSSFQR